MSNILSAHKLTKKYSDGTKILTVLDGIDMEVNHGDRIAIIGPSGTGKSTLLHILAGLDRPTKGDVHFLKHNIADIKEYKKCKLRNEHFGFVYQHHHLLKDFSVLENIMMPLLIKGVKFAEAKQHSLSMLQKLSLEERASFNVAKLSGGEKQRVAILRALVNSPKILFADEPTGNLCQTNAERVYSSMLELHQKLESALIVVTHDMQLADKMNIIYELDNGKLRRVK